MLGALIGDIAGSRFESHNIKTKEFDLFTHTCHVTDDSVMTLAVAKALMDQQDDLLTDSLDELFISCMQELGKRYPRAGYGGRFRAWLYESNPQPYNSWGNGSAMRVSPCGYCAQTLEDAIFLARESAKVTHNHAEGIKGAEAVAAAIFLARDGKNMLEIRDYIEKHYYELNFTLDSVRSEYTFDVYCQGSVPQALEAFFESTSFEDTIRNAISIGGDSDTIAAIAGSVAEAYYGIPEEIRKQALTFLDEYQLDILNRFESRYGEDITRNVNINEYLKDIEPAEKEFEGPLRCGQVLKTVYNLGSMKVLAYSGDDGQGWMYKVAYEDTEKVLKIYRPGVINDKTLFKANLENNIKNGPSLPNGFIWPEAMVDTTDDNGNELFGCVMDITPSGYYDMVDFIDARQHFTSFRALLDAMIKLVCAFGVLHREGYVFSDLNYNNFIFNPTNGDAVIINNGNVVPYGTNTGIMGNIRFMAPEIVKGYRVEAYSPEKGRYIKTALPTIGSDRFSLAVILFMLLFHNHPLEGSRWFENGDVPQNEQAQEDIYANPVFICDMLDRTNKPTREVHKALAIMWPSIPNYARAFFCYAFRKEAMMDPNRRVIEQYWLELLARMRNEVYKCPYCGNEEFISNAGNVCCENCHEQLGPLKMLQVNGSKLHLPNKKDVLCACNYDIPMTHGTLIAEIHCGNGHYEEAMKRIVGFIEKNGQYGIKNLSDEDVICEKDDVRYIIKPGEIKGPVSEGMRFMSDKLDVQVQ